MAGPCWNEMPAYGEACVAAAAGGGCRAAGERACSATSTESTSSSVATLSASATSSGVSALPKTWCQSADTVSVSRPLPQPGFGQERWEVGPAGAQTCRLSLEGGAQLFGYPHLVTK